MLIYHHAFDPYHCAFRVLAVLERMPKAHWELEKIRLLDFLLVFPGQLAKLRLPQGSQAIKKRAALLENHFNTPADPRQLLYQMAPLQVATLQALARAGILKESTLSDGFVERSPVPLPAQLADVLADSPSLDSALLNFVATKLGALPLLGPDGLKGRSGLMEHKYDPT